MEHGLRPVHQPGLRAGRAALDRRLGGAVEGNLLVTSTWSDGANLFGKGNGLADLEIICDQAPVQIGNRVWYDSDGDGIQDPSEPPIAGVVVTLTDRAGNKLTATTDANGEYYLGTKDGLKPDTSYEVAFDYSRIDPSKLPGSPTLDQLKWTQRRAGSDPAIDSTVDSAGKTTVRVGDPGFVDHDLDAAWSVRSTGWATTSGTTPMATASRTRTSPGRRTSPSS